MELLDNALHYGAEYPLNYILFHQEYDDDNPVFSVIAVVDNSYDLRRHKTIVWRNNISL